MSSPPWFQVVERSALAPSVVSAIAEVAIERAAAARRWSLALPGGSVATEVIPSLSRAAVPWGAADIFLCDERAVTASDPESNWGLCERLWEGTEVPGRARLHPAIRGGEDPRLAASAYAAELTAICGNPPVLDVVLLGVGEDGHVASIFPGATVGPGPVEVVEHSPKPPPTRLTLTLDVLASARLTVVVAMGRPKRNAVRWALDGAERPVAELLRRARQPLLVVDPDAAP